MSRRALRTCLFVLAALPLACGGGDGATVGDAAPSATRDPFIAVDSDFTPFHTWESFPVPVTSAPASVHTGGTRVEYLSGRPPPGSTAFPVGTIIVKEMTSGAPEDRHTFAMVKRGKYNMEGAAGWEWFELKADEAVIKWRGVGPPAGEKYGGDPNAGCNSCHAAARDNDSVLSPTLRLDSL